LGKRPSAPLRAQAPGRVLDAVEPFLPDLHVLFKRLAQAKLRLSAQLASELGATRL